MRKLTIILAVFAGVVSAAIIPISILDYTYSPDTANIVQGDSVVWTNTTALPHTTTSGANGVPDGIWNSGTLNSGGMFGRAFNVVGSFPYFCIFHYPIHGMAGEIHVGTAGIEDSRASSEPGSLSLEARPNPFRAATEITCGPVAAGNASLRIYRVSGQLVKTLGIGATGSGHRTAVWNGTDDQDRVVAKGVYVARLIGTASNGELQVLKLD